MQAEIIPSLASLSQQDWERCLAGEAEGWDYHTALLRCPPPAMQPFFLIVRRNGMVIALAPGFSLNYRLDTALQGRIKHFSNGLAKVFPGLFTLKLMALGSAYTERCQIGFCPSLDAGECKACLQLMLETLGRAAAGQGAGLIGLKDVMEDISVLLGQIPAGRAFVRMNSLPYAVLDLPFASEEDYIRSLSANKRSTVRRKLRSARNVRIEMRGSIEGLESQIEELYEQTRAKSSVDYGDFEDLPQGYFIEISNPPRPDVAFMLFWVDDTLAGFNLLLIEKDRLIDKYVGMRYPLSDQNNLYTVRWMANVRLCLERNIAQLQSGQTAYGEKLQFGSRLVPAHVYFRHKNPVIHFILKAISLFLSFDSLDPTLQSKAKTR